MDWFRWYPSKWLSGVLHLNNEQRGVYIQVINVLLDRGECSADPAYLGRLCNCNRQKAARIVSELVALEKLHQSDGKLHQDRAQSERKDAIERSQSAAVLSSKRWNNNGMSHPASESKPHTHTESDKKDIPPTPSECPPLRGGDAHANGSAKPKSRPVGTRLAEDWRPSSEAVAHCQQELGCGTSLLKAEFPNFQCHFLAATGTTARKVDWDRTFINWMRRARRDEVRHEQRFANRQRH